MGISDYIRLIESFLDQRLPIEEFKDRYLTTFKQEKGRMNPMLFAVLQDLFEDIDAYSPLWTEEDVSPIRITEKLLRAEAAQALKELRVLQSS